MGEKKKSGHVTIALPADLVKEIDALVGRFGFRSRSEFVKEAVRKLLDHYRGIIPLTVKPKEEKKAEE